MKPAARLRAAVAATLICCGQAAFAGGPSWPDVPYSYFANNTKLEAVLADFAGGFNLSLAIQPDLTGVVNGRFASPNPADFLTRLASMYGFVWYTHAGTLFVSRASGVVTRGVAAPGGNVASMHKALASLGVLQPRFGWGELADQGIAVVSGPPSYISLIESTIGSLPERAQQLRVFRLRYASAEDRVVPFRDQQTTTPGIASILRKMVAGGVTPLSLQTGFSPATAMLPNGMGTPSAGMGTPVRPATPMGEISGAPGSVPQIWIDSTAGMARGPVPTIQAEPRLNAVVIQDLPERMPLYQQLIDQLDIPSVLVEIEAMIVDINTDRASELGVNWSGRVGKTNFGFGQNSGSAAAATLSFSGNFSAGNYLLSRLSLLETNGDAEIQARPSVLTSENLSAVLDLSETFYIRTQGERVASVTPVVAGTTLRVTPHVVYRDGRTFVQMKIDIEDGRITSNLIDSLPTVARSSVNTEATVPQGEALLIAGYTSNQNIRSRQQVPVLGDIPAVGALFGSNTRTVQKRERFFLIRPRVVEIGGQPQASAPAQIKEFTATAEARRPVALEFAPSFRVNENR